MKNKNTILRAILVFAFSLGIIFFIKNKIGADDAFDVIKKIGPGSNSIWRKYEDN